ncbi:MAG: hypothetical protein ACOH2H_07095 [Cypionkella sp.]
MAAVLAHNATLGRLIRTGGWAELAEGTPRLIARALDAGDLRTSKALADFFLGEMRVVYDIYAQWFPDTHRCLTDRGMAPADVHDAHSRIRARLAPYHASALRPRAEVWAEIVAAVDAIGAEMTADRHAALNKAVKIWRDLHDCEVDQLSGLFDLMILRHGEAGLREMYEGWVIGDWFAKRYQRFDISQIDWATASWLLIYLGLEGHHGHLSGMDRIGTIDVAEDAEKVTLSFAPCGSGGRSVAGEWRDGLPPLRDAALGWAELKVAHDFTWNKTGVCSYCAHCCLLHEILPIASFGYPVRVTDPPTAPLSGESRCSWTVYKDLRAIPEAAYTRVGAVKPPATAPLGSDGRAERDRMMRHD